MNSLHHQSCRRIGCTLHRNDGCLLSSHTVAWHTSSFLLQGFSKLYHRCLLQVLTDFLYSHHHTLHSVVLSTWPGSRTLSCHLRLLCKLLHFDKPPVCKHFYLIPLQLFHKDYQMSYGGRRRNDPDTDLHCGMATCHCSSGWHKSHHGNLLGKCTLVHGVQDGRYHHSNRGLMSMGPPSAHSAYQHALDGSHNDSRQSAGHSQVCPLDRRALRDTH